MSASVDATRPDAAVDWTLAAAMLGAALLLLASTLSVLSESRWPGPVVDMWRFVALLEAHGRGAPLLDALWEPHAGHRLVFPKLFYWVDYRCFGGRNLFLLLSAVGLQAGIGSMLVVRFARERARVGSAGVAVFAGAALALLFSASQAENLARGWNLHWPLSHAMVLSALLALEAACRSRDEGRGAAGWLAVAAASAWVASGSMANGLAVWLALLFVALALRAPRSWLAALTLAGIGAVAVYAVDYSPVQGMGGRTLEPLRTLRWFAACLGSPASREANVALACGATFALAMAALAVATLRRPGAGSEVVLAGVVVFGLASALLVAAGRARLAPGGWAGARYQSLVLLIWLAFLGWVLLRATPGGRRWAAAVAVAWVGLVLLPAHFEAADALREQAEDLRRAQLAIAVGVAHRPSYRRSLPLVPHCGQAVDCAQQLAPFLREQGLGMFAEPGADLLGSRVDELEQIDSSACHVHLSGAEVLRAADLLAPPPGARLEGRVRMDSGEAPLALLVADRAGVVTGLGRSSLRAPESGEAADGVPWVAFTAAPTAGGSVSLWALLDGGKVCRLAESLVLWPGRQ